MIKVWQNSIPQFVYHDPCPSPSSVKIFWPKSELMLIAISFFCCWRFMYNLKWYFHCYFLPFPFSLDFLETSSENFLWGEDEDTMSRNRWKFPFSRFLKISKSSFELRILFCSTSFLSQMLMTSSLYSDVSNWVFLKA